MSSADAVSIRSGNGGRKCYTLRGFRYPEETILIFRLLVFPALVLTLVAAPTLAGQAGVQDVDESRLLRLHAVYVTTRDRAPLPRYEERVGRLMRDVQAFYREEMRRNGYGPLTFRLDLDKSGRVRVPLVTLDRDFAPAWKWTPRELRPAIAKVLAGEGIDIERSYFVAFMNAYWQDGATWKYDVVYTGAGGPDHGATWVTDHEWLDPLNFEANRTERLDDRGQKLTIGQFNVKMIGGVAHELGHGLGLPHNRERPDEGRVLGRALMGAGNYTYHRERISEKPGAFLTAAHAFALSLHPLFTGKRATDLSTPNVSVDNMQFEESDGLLLVTGRVAPPDRVAGVVLYHDPLPTGTNQDYDAWSYLARYRANGSFAAAIDLPKPGEFALHLRVYFRNGTFARFSFQHTVTTDRKPGLQALRAGYVWTQVRSAFAAKAAQRLAELVKQVEDLAPQRTENARRLAAIAKQWQSFSRPVDVGGGMREVSLSSCRWDDAKVGWFMPSFDQVLTPDGDAVEPLASRDRRHDHGLYAHADSRYAYALGGKWETFSAHCALQARHSGSVVFVIRGDGKELFRSDLVRLRDGEQPVQVEVTGVTQLELITESGGDGKDSDWGVWLSPVLRR